MKRNVMLVMCLMVLSSGVFALDKAIGGGILFNATSTNGSINAKTIDAELTGNFDWTMSRTGFGVFGFFGLNQFIELNLGFLYKNPSELELSYGGQTQKMKDSGIDSVGALQFGVYGKYPIPISDMLVFFPTGGVDFELTLGGGSDSETGFDWWSDFWIRGGVGLDVFISETMFVRSHLIYGAAIPVGGSSDLGLSFGHGLLIKVGLGLML